MLDEEHERLSAEYIAEVAEELQDLCAKRGWDYLASTLQTVVKQANQIVDAKAPRLEKEQ